MIIVPYLQKICKQYGILIFVTPEAFVNHTVRSVPLVISFLFTEGIIYLIFLALDLSGHGEQTLCIKYVSTLLCLLTALQNGNRQISCAIAITIAADWFLLILGEHFLFGVFLFLISQFLYANHLHQLGSTYAPLLRIGLFSVLFPLELSLGLLTPLNLLCVIYFSCLVSNAILAWTLPPAKPLAIGLTMFICCDICVGLVNTVSLPSCIHRFVFAGMWFFYLPAQILITLSTLQRRISYEC